MYIEFYGIIIILAAWIGFLFYPRFCRTRQTCPTGPTPNTHKLMQLKKF